MTESTLRKCLLLSLAAGPLLVSGCATPKMRLEAGQTIHELTAQTTIRDAGYEEAVKNLTRQVLEAKRQALLAEFAAKKASQKVEVYRRYELKRLELEQLIDEQIKSVLKGPLETLRQNLEKERAAALRTGSREMEVSAALQLAATMAEAEGRKTELYLESAQQLAQKRAAQIAQIDAIEAPAEIARGISQRRIDALFSELSAEGKAFRGAVRDSESGLEEFIASIAPRSIGQDFFRGFVGDKLSFLFSDALGDEIDALDAKMDGALNDLIHAGRDNET